jgi:hypothetical protein
MDVLNCFESFLYNEDLYTLDDFLNEPLMLSHEICNENQPIKIDKNTINTDKFRIKINNNIHNKNKTNIISGDIHKSYLSQALVMKKVDRLVLMKEYDKNHWKCRYIIRQFIDKQISYTEAVYKLQYNKYKMDSYKRKI